MRSLLSVICALLLGASVLLLPRGSVAYADFHCMRIHAVMGGFGSAYGSVQYVELRMTAAGQANISGHIIRFYDGSNTLKATFTFPSNVTNASIGDSVLIATSEFNSRVTGGAADFTFSGNTTGSGDINHPVQSTGGKVVFAPSPAINCGNPTSEVDSVAYGSGTPNFGTGAASALPSPADEKALRLKILAYPPTENSTNYELAPVSTTTFSVAPENLALNLSTPRNNGRTVLRLNGPASVASVGGVAEQPHAASANAVAARAADDGGRDGVVYVIGGGIVAAAIACAAGWYVYRRRTPAAP